MVYTTLGVVFLAVVAAVIIQRSRARHAARKETERDIERAEGEGMVGRPVHD